MKKLSYLLLAFILFWVFGIGNQTLAVTDEQLGNKADKIEKTQKKENTEKQSKDTDKSDKKKEGDDKYEVQKSGGGHGGVPTSGNFKP